MKNEKKQTGRVNYIWVLAGGYLTYLAYQLFKGVFSGETDQLFVSVGGGVLFVAVGAWLLHREWKAYKYGQAHMDDPETWNDDPEAWTGSPETGDGTPELPEAPEEPDKEDEG